MVTLTSVLCLVTVQCMGMLTLAANGPTLDANPTSIITAITPRLNVNCTFSLKDHPDMIGIVSLILLRANSSGQNFEELAVITEFSPDSVTIVTQKNVSATGLLRKTEESFLQAAWDYPSATQAGAYKCAAHTLNVLGDYLEMIGTVNVTAQEGNLNDIIDKMKQMENDKTVMENEIYNLRNTSSIQEQTLSNMGNYIQSLEHNNTEMSSYITYLEQVAATQGQCRKNTNNMTFIGLYNSTEYYLSKEEVDDFNRILDVCKSYGGKLAEINDEIEFNALKTFLNYAAPFRPMSLMIGGTDSASEGKWTFPSNNEPVSFLDMASDQPDGGRKQNCLWMRTVDPDSWEMGDYACHVNPPLNYTRYLCEIPNL